MKKQKQKTESKQRELNVEFSQEKMSVIREAFQQMYSQTGVNEEALDHENEDA